MFSTLYVSYSHEFNYPNARLPKAHFNMLMAELALAGVTEESMHAEIEQIENFEETLRSPDVPEEIKRKVREALRCQGYRPVEIRHIEFPDEPITESTARYVAHKKFYEQICQENPWLSVDQAWERVNQLWPAALAEKDKAS